MRRHLRNAVNKLQLKSGARHCALCVEAEDPKRAGGFNREGIPVFIPPVMPIETGEF